MRFMLLVIGLMIRLVMLVFCVVNSVLVVFRLL